MRGPSEKPAPLSAAGQAPQLLCPLAVGQARNHWRAMDPSTGATEITPRPRHANTCQSHQVDLIDATGLDSCHWPANCSAACWLAAPELSIVNRPVTACPIALVVSYYLSASDRP